MSAKRTVRISRGLNNPPPLSARQKKALDDLAKMPDSAIDYSDIPAMMEADEPLYKLAKKATTIRLDADVVSWLHSLGEGYQNRANDILRHEMLVARKAEV
jgi:uncharacterized protein (DUF4415 family)